MTDEKTVEPKNPEVADTATKFLERSPFNEISVLFPLLSLYTAAYLALMVADFALKEAFTLPDGIMPVYVALLGAYAADKEIRRWLGSPEPPRKGTFFVYLWLLLFLSAYLIICFRPEFTLPGNLVAVSLQVLGIFFGSKASKYIHENRKVELDPDMVSRQEGQVMELIQTQGRVQNKEVAELLGVSSATAKRLLAELVRLGRLRLEGATKGSYYVPVDPASPPDAKPAP